MKDTYLFILKCRHYSNYDGCWHSSNENFKIEADSIVDATNKMIKHCTDNDCLEFEIVMLLKNGVEL